MAAASRQDARRSTRQAVPASSRVAIIGGGISGLAAAKQLAAHDPVVFEATASVGGVWKHCVYRSTRLQTPRRDYEFSDYSWRNRDDPTFPTHAEIVEYLEGYADAFGLWRYIVLGARVVDVKFLGGGGLTELWSGGAAGQPPLRRGKPLWEVGVATAGSDTVQVRVRFAYLLLVLHQFPPLRGQASVGFSFVDSACPDDDGLCYVYSTTSSSSW
jgi:dimethylaniline monooxygenase (N-oxide forming)